MPVVWFALAAARAVGPSSDPHVIGAPRMAPAGNRRWAGVEGGLLSQPMHSSHSVTPPAAPGYRQISTRMDGQIFIIFRGLFPFLYPCQQQRASSTRTKYA